MSSLNHLIKWYFSRGALPYWSVLLLDSSFVFFSGLLAYTLHHGAARASAVFGPLMATLCVFVVCFIIGFRIFHTYDGVIRFSSFGDLMRVTKAVLLGVVLSAVAQWLLSGTGHFLMFSVADLTLFALFTVAFMWTIRVWVKMLYEDSIRRPNRIPAFILGIRSGGAALAKNINSMQDSPYKVAGFVDNERDLQDRHLMGVPVYTFDDDLPALMVNRGIKVLIVSPLMMNFIRENAHIIDSLAEARIKIMVVPNAREWDGKSDISAASLKPVDVEDLLPREKIEVDMQAAADLLHGHTVMITGAAGSIGSEMVRQIAAYSPARMILVDQAETPMHDIRLMMRNEHPDTEAHTIVADIADPKMMRSLFSRFRPEYVFHAAAYKHVPMMEDNPYESIINNVNGTRIIADLSVEFGTKKFVMVSTDKAVNPTNVMGCSKRICEIYVQALDKAIKEGSVNGETRFVTTRFGNVLGSNGSVIPIFQEQIKKGGPVTVTHPDIIRYFMLIPEACKLVIEAGTMGNGGEIYVFDMGEPVRIADLAKRMITLSGAKDVEIKFTGLRDGEKLYEEVLNDKEVTLPTFHPKIKIARVREYGFGEVDRAVAELIASASADDDMSVVARMKQMVPEFKSQHSKYQELDK